MKSQNLNYELIGRRVAKTLPRIAEMVMRQSKVKILFSDYKDIAEINKVFSEYFRMEFPAGLKHLPLKESTELRIKFTTVSLVCFDPESVTGPYYKKVNNGLRQHIANNLNTNHSLVSQYVPKARVYMSAYSEFNSEISDLVETLKDRHRKKSA